ncbi:hypothetical protein FRX31_033672, partial [Thalictrum thalictroides]
MGFPEVNACLGKNISGDFVNIGFKQGHFAFNLRGRKKLREGLKNRGDLTKINRSTKMNEIM